MAFKAIREYKILAKISEFTVYPGSAGQEVNNEHISKFWLLCFFPDRSHFLSGKNNSRIQIEKWQSEALSEILRNDVFWASLITSC